MKREALLSLLSQISPSGPVPRASTALQLLYVVVLGILILPMHILVWVLLRCPRWSVVGRPKK